MTKLGPLLLLPVSLSLLLDSGNCGESPKYEELEGLDSSQKESLQQLKQAVSSDGPHDYMKEDIYLVKFLQASSFDAKKAEVQFKEMVKWRKDNDVDSWDKSDKFADLEENYPNLENGLDKSGRPNRESPYGKWDVQGAAMKGKLNHLANYALRSTERCSIKIREQQAKGNNVTTWNMLLNMEGFSLMSWACVNCMTLYNDFVNGLEKYYPYSLNKVVVVNTPTTFKAMYKLLTPLLSKRTQETVIMFGTDKGEWKPYVDEMVEANQLADWFDGKKPTSSQKSEPAKAKSQNNKMFGFMG